MGALGKVLDFEAPDVGRSAEAAAAILLARLALRFARLESLALVSRRLSAAARAGGTDDPGSKPGPGDAESCERVAWAASAAAAALKQTCLPRAVALQWMLARRGVEAELCLGFPRGGSRLPGHAWVEVGSRRIGDGPEADPRGPGDGGLEVLCRLPREKTPSAGPAEPSAASLPRAARPSAAGPA
ncbi:MAG: lasso peptide biosynthesis B2 protein [Acidobacteria bacterium]|nr:MAG: lasso peptide biosynthesis B2 protein [Acidobacteriota bacterium]